jgi:hypothetical protein
MQRQLDKWIWTDISIYASYSHRMAAWCRYALLHCLLLACLRNKYMMTTLHGMTSWHGTWCYSIFLTTSYICISMVDYNLQVSKWLSFLILMWINSELVFARRVAWVFTTKIVAWTIWFVVRSWFTIKLHTSACCSVRLTLDSMLVGQMLVWTLYPHQCICCL